MSGPNTLLWSVSLQAFAISVILTPILRDVFRAYNVVDRPGFRRMHVYPIPRIGGIPIAAAYAFALYMFSLSPVLGFPVWKLLPVGLVFLTGLLDDFFNLRPLVKLAGQTVAALWVFWNGLRIETLGGTMQLPLWLDLPLTVFWLLLTTNALNLIDGLDGLCAGIGLLATLAMFTAAILHGNLALVYATLPLACALVGFLCYNINPATVFLGDSGALTVGFLLGCYGMIWTQKTSTLISLLVPLMALSVPLLDVAVAVLRRLLRRQPIFTADRAHIHHRLLDRGLTPKNAVLVLYVFAAAAAGLALILSAPQVARFRNLLLVLLVAAFWLGLRELKYKEFHLASRMLFGGELQQNLQERLLMDRVSVALTAAHSREEWWLALSEIARDCQWASLRWRTTTGAREVVYVTSAPAWTFSVPLEDGDMIEVHGVTGSAAINLNEFAALVQKTSDRQTHAWEPSEVR